MTSPNSKVPRGEAVVSRILDCALAEVAESGYGGLSLERVAERAGVAKTTVWRRWPTTAALVRCAFEAHITGLQEQDVRGALRPTLVSLLRNLAAHLTSDLGRGLFAALASESGSGELGEILGAVCEKAETWPKLVILQAIERGELPPGVDPLLTFDMLVGGLKHRVFHARRAVTEAYLCQLVDAVLAGVAHVALQKEATPPAARKDSKRRARAKPARAADRSRSVQAR